MDAADERIGATVLRGEKTEYIRTSGAGHARRSAADPQGRNGQHPNTISACFAFTARLRCQDPQTPENEQSINFRLIIV
jgi:hypothetical protein